MDALEQLKLDLGEAHYNAQILQRVIGRVSMSEHISMIKARTAKLTAVP
jgi:hypothetical protein